MGSSVDVTIRDASVSKAKVEELTREHCEHIDRDSNGEILSGGNTYVHVNRTSEINEALAAQYLDAVGAAFAKLDEAKPSYNVEVEGQDNVHIGFDCPPSTYFVRVWIGGRPGYSCQRDEDGVRSVALQIADYQSA